MIKLVNLRRSFQKRIVFDYFSYDFNDTGLYILTGDNGCGKTTLLYFLALIDDGFKGKYLFDKEDLNILTPKKKEEFRKKNISLLLPRGNLIDFLNVGENRSLFVDKEQKNFDHLESNRSIHGLSGGEEILLSLSNELSKSKKLYLLDEVTSSLSNAHAKEIMDILKEQAKSSLVILASHDERIMDYGKIVHIDSKESKSAS